MLRLPACAVIVFCFCISWSSAETNLLPDQLNSIRIAGVQALMNMNYQNAKTSFEVMVQTAPDHPAGYIYLANTIWLGHLAELRRLQTSVYNRGDSFFGKKEDEVDPDVDKQFRETMNKGIELAETLLKKDKKNIPALYYLGIAKNIVAGYEATVKRSFMAALRNGSRGVDLHRDVMKLCSDCIDAQLSVGMYNYVVGSLPLAVKIVAFIGGVRGSKKDGIAMLEKVATEGNYAKDEGKVLLIMLYNREKRLEDGLKLLSELTADFPGNSLFRLEHAMTLGQVGRFRDSAKEFDAMLLDSSITGYIPDLLHYQYATMLFDARQWQKAYEQYLAAASSPKAPASLVTVARLNSAKCLDALGKRDLATEEYTAILKRLDVFDSHDTARKYLKKPFAP